MAEDAKVQTMPGVRRDELRPGPQLHSLRRRETRRSRVVPAVIVALSGILVLAWAGAEVAGWQAGRPELVLGPPRALDWLASLPEALPSPLLLLAAGIALVLGVMLAWFAITPGARSRRVLLNERAAVIADDSVLAAELVRVAALSARLPEDRVTARLRRNTAEVRIRPMPGTVPDAEATRIAVETRLSDAGLARTPRLTLRVDEAGRTGGAL